MTKYLAGLIVLSSFAVMADPQRSLLTRENRYPGVGDAELGALYDYSDFNVREVNRISPYVRYGLITNLTASIKVPGVSVDAKDVGQSYSGLGDVSVGLDLKAYEDDFEHTFMIPHVEVAFPTGDEEKFLGEGRTVTTVGISLGTTTHDCLHWIVDGRCAIDGGGTQDNPDTLMMFSGALIWDLDKKCSVLAEGRIMDDNGSNGDTESFVQAGFTYKFSKKFTMAFYGGSGSGGDGKSSLDSSFSVKADYCF